ncbi:MAG: hypothetical protein H7Y04_12640 [Verrucomicrobia bacterium]|nr:hypothetical protein [Cytophagales bacterium]
MEEYTRDYQIEYAIDWFFLGQNNNIAHFNSAGGILPDIIAKNAQDNIVLNDYFKNIKPFTEVIINPFLDKYFNMANINSVLDYSYYATKGFFTFDKTFACPGDFDITYHLIATPVKPLNFNTLPNHMREILLKTKQGIKFEDFQKLDVGYIPWASLFTDYYVRALYEKSVKKKTWLFF